MPGFVLSNEPTKTDFVIATNVNKSKLALPLPWQGSTRTNGYTSPNTDFVIARPQAVAIYNPEGVK